MYIFADGISFRIVLYAGLAQGFKWCERKYFQSYSTVLWE